MVPRTAQSTAPLEMERFVELVRDALLHLYDLAQLRTHPLAFLAVDPSRGAKIDSSARARHLRRELLDSIEALRVAPGTPTTSRDWRIYHILERRYIDGLETAEVIGQIALSRAQYHREHQRAIQALAEGLWERWQLAGRWADNDSESSAPRSEGSDLAREEANRLIAAKELDWIDLDDLLQGVGRLLEPLCARHHAAIVIAPASSLPPIQGNRVALRNALLALLGRAIRLIENSTIEVSASIRAVEVEIGLTGPAHFGLDRSQFDLAGSRPLVDAIGGRVTLTLPPELTSTWQMRVVVPTPRRPVLLVVDNNTDFIQLVERLTDGTNWQVVGCNEVESAWDFVRNHRPAAILLDIVIPGRDGWELLVGLHAQPTLADVPVIVCSVLQEPELAGSLGAWSYLPKPITRQQLFEVLDTVPETPAN